jgi:hypothetical protein
LSTKTNANTGQVLRKTRSWSFLPAQVNLHALRYLLLCAVVFHGLAPGRAWAQPASDEDHIKAAFLFHFAQLVEWPADALDHSGSSLFLCTLEDDAFYDELENTIEGKQIGSRTIRIRHVHVSQVTRGCNMLFISKRESKSLPLGTLRNLPVLTVGEADDFLSSGGMIRFRLAEDRIRFDINLDAADSSHLKISSRLLLLATSVIRGSSMDKGR